MISPQGLTYIGFSFAILGFFLQTLNVAYALRHLQKRCTLFNGVLLFSLVLYAASFIPLFFTSMLSFSIFETGKQDLFTLELISRFNRTHNAFYAFATLSYLILIQIRFRIIKSLVPYRDIYDFLFVWATIIIWSATTFLFGVVAFGSVPQFQSLAFSALWSLYALIVDNVLSWIFLYQLFKCRTKVANSNRLKQLWTHSIWGLSLLTLMTWICLALTLVATFAYANNTMFRSMVYRIAYAFSPLQFSGALVFIYTIRSLFEAQDNVDKSQITSKASSETLGSIHSVDSLPTLVGTTNESPVLLFSIQQA